MNPTSANFLTWTELTTLGGAITAVTAVTNGMWYALGWNPRHFGLIVAFGLSIAAVAVSDPSSLEAWITLIPNTFIIYAGAVGLSGMTTGLRRPPRRQKPPGAAIEETIPGRYARSFWESWY